MLQEIILQNRNHPSIILWGVRINESVDDDAFYNRTNKIAPPPSWTPAAPPPACDTIGARLETQEHFSFTSPLRGTANKPDPPVWLVCNIKINVSAEYTQGAAEDLLNQKLSLSSHIHRSR